MVSIIFQPNTEDIKLAKSKLFKDINKVWDGTGYNVNIEKLRDINAKNQAIYQYFKAHPKTLIIAKYSIIGIIVTIIITIISLIFGFLLPDILIPEIALFFFFISIIGFIITPILVFMLAILLISSYYLITLSRDLIKLEIANENNWIYNPNRNEEIANKYASKFPEIFNKGGYRYFEDTMWGNFTKDNKRYDFLTGMFYFAKNKNPHYHKDNQIYFTRNFFIIRLPKHLQSRFLLYPENIVSQLDNMFTGKEINTEFVKFNKTFAFSYNGQKNEQALQIVKTLSPRVQEELVKFADRKKRFLDDGPSILFADNSVIFIGAGKLLPTMKTNFIFKGMDIDKRDKDYIKNEIETMINISTEVVKYLD